MDFESGAIAAFQDCISFVQLHGCHFHFCQSIFRKLSTLGLKGQYTDVAFRSFGTFVKCIFALPFLPVERIPNTFDELVNLLEDDYEDAGVQYPRALVDFIAYLKKTWVDDDSKYPKEMWNIRNLGDRRTNNYVEGWHSLCRKHFGVGKNLWKFLMQLKKLEAQTRALLQLQESGENVNTRRLKQKRKEGKINRILQGYHSDVYEDDIAFVRALAHLQASFTIVEDAD